MDDQSTYVGPTAAAKLAALAKAAAKNAITVDDQLYSQSTHPVQNKVVTAALGEKAGKSVATPYINGLMSAADKAKLDGIEAGATKNSTATATADADGLMSAADKVKLDGIEDGATKTIVDDAMSDTSTNPVQNKIVTAELDKKAGKDVATADADGLMSAEDKVKLDGIEDGATKTIVDDAMSDTSTNPVQNKVIKKYIDEKGVNYFDTYVEKPTKEKLTAYADYYTCECKATHTYAEIAAALAKDMVPRVLLVDVIGSVGANRIVCPLNEYYNGADGSYDFDAPNIAGMYGYGTGIVSISEDGAVYTCSAGELPPATDKDNGKCLVVDGGRYRCGTPAAATQSTPGNMSAADKAKLDGIEAGANKTVVDAALDAGSANPVQNKVVKAALDKKADKTALDTKADTTVATASANGLMSAADKEKLDSMYDIVATSTDGETFDITPAQLHEKLKGVPTTCAIKVVDTIIPLYRVQLQSGGDTRYIFQITKDNGFWEPNTRLAYTASAGGTYAGTTWVKSEYDLLASTPGILKFTGAAKAQFSGSKDVTIDIPTGEGTVRYDETQKLTSDQKFRASQNIGAVSQKHAFIDGVVMLQAIGHDDGASVVNITPSEKSNDYTLTLDGGPENVPVYVAGLETPTDAQTDCATNVAYVKAKIAEVAASGGVDVDNALSATSTNPVQNKVVKAALDKKAGTAVASTSANGLMSKADKTKLDDIERGANKTTIDSAMSGSSVNPVQNKVIKQYIDDKVAAAGSNITVDAELSATSTNPVQNKAVKAAVDGKADKTALDAKMDKSGGTFTGNVYGKYFCGTWLQSTEASDLGRTPGKIAVLDDSGWVYYRTPSELFGDLGIANAIKSYVDTAIAVAINSAY